MSNSDNIFALIMQYGGQFVKLKCQEIYGGGRIICRNGLDSDLFGYFDLVDEVKKVGLGSWDKLLFRTSDNTYRSIKNDSDVMSMLSYLDDECRHVKVYVEGGRKVGETEIFLQENIENPEEDCDYELEDDLGAYYDEKYQKMRAKGKGKEIANEGCKQRESVSVRAQVSEKVAKKHIQKQSDVLNGLMREKITRKVDEKCSDKSSERVTTRVIKRSQTKAKSKWKIVDEDIDENEDFSSENEDYIPDVETDDDLSDTALASDDEEYVRSRQNLRIDRETYNDISKYIGTTQGYVFDDDIEMPVSEYDDSDDGMCSYETDDECDFIRNRKKNVAYDPKCDHKTLLLQLGMQFESGFQCRDGLTTYAICNGWTIHFSRVSKVSCEANCDYPCPWRCYGSVVKADNTFVIKTLVEPHECSMSMDNLLVSSKWIAKQYLNVFRMRKKFTIDDLRADILERYNCRVKNNRLYKARKIALETIRGTDTAHYAKLRRYIAEMIRSDRDGRFELLLHETGEFKGLFISFSSLVKGFREGCRPVIGIDGCFLKTHLEGMLLCAVAKDGNNQMFPFAWAIVEVEDEANWRWFIKLILEVLNSENGFGYTFVSDQQKGLVNAVTALAPQCEHRNCARHAYANWSKKHKGLLLRKMFWKACKSTYVERWQIWLDRMKEEKEEAYMDFMAREPQKFCKAFISIFPKSDMIYNNISETFNGYILAARGKHVINMCEEIRVSIMERQYRKMEEIASVTDRLCPMIRKKLEKKKRKSTMCETHGARHRLYEVHYLDDVFVVSLDAKECTCRRWQLTGIPCVHACSAIHFMRKDAADFVDDYYTVERYKKTYEYGIVPLRGENMWPQADGWPVKPPLLRARPGRPKKKRAREHNERNPKNPSKLKRFGLKMTCTNCFQQGHNNRKCPNPRVEKPKKVNVKRGRPRKENTEPAASTSTNKKASKSVPLKVKKTIAKERAQARKAVGVLITESGNIYTKSSTLQKGVRFLNPRSLKPQRKSSLGQCSNSTITDVPSTQESRINE